MADQLFNGVTAAFGVQTGFGVPLAAITGLTTPVDLADGAVLGDAESGDAESGIVIPNIVAISRDVAVVAGTFSQSADAFQKAEINSFAISWVMQGNGVSATPAVGEADLSVIMPGVEAIFDGAGLVGSVGGLNVEQDYDPRTAGNLFLSVKIWHGDLAFVFTDCIVESLEFVCTPGGFVIATANILVGTFDHTTTVDGFTFPASDYGIMASLAGPIVEGVAFSSFGVVRGFENLTVLIASEIEKFGDSNVLVTGERQAQRNRIITVNGTLYVDDVAANSEAAFQNLVDTSAPTVDLSFQVGTPATGAGNIINAFKIFCNKLQAKDIKYNRIGTTLVVELNDAKCTSPGPTGGDEFQLQMN